MKIVITKNLGLYPDQKERLENLGDVMYYGTECSSPDEWYDRCKDADIICTGRIGLDSEAVFKLKDTFISLPFVGYDFLDLNKLKKLGVTVSNAPGCNKEAVAEWVIGMLLMLFRRLDALTDTAQLNNQKALQQGLNIWNKKITILGAGNIGKHLNTILTAFGAETSFFRRGDNLLSSVKNADIVINCLAANESTKNLLDRNFFQSLKKDTFFISIARPQIYDVDALINRLDSGHLAGAIDDIANARVGDVDDPLYQKLANHPKILATPHISWNSESEARRANDMMIDNIESWINKKPINILNG